MPLLRLDQQLLKKLVKKTAKSEQYIREQISKRASRRGVSSEAAQILWAKEFGLGTARFQRSLLPHLQEQVRDALPSVFARQAAGSVSPRLARTASRPKGKDTLRLAIEYLLADDELRRRCGDLLRARGSFDRVFREATTVLDDRIKRLGGIKGKINPATLAAKVLNPDPRKAILKVSDDADEQDGFFSICKGLFLAFRNPTHHELSDKFTREDALRFCGFVDAMLAILNKAEKSPATT